MMKYLVRWLIQQRHKKVHEELETMSWIELSAIDRLFRALGIRVSTIEEQINIEVDNMYQEYEDSKVFNGPVKVRGLPF